MVVSRGGFQMNEEKRKFNTTSLERVLMGLGVFHGV
jgi:hypothetical protein